MYQADRNLRERQIQMNRVIFDETRRKPRVLAAGAAMEKERFYGAGIGLRRERGWTEGTGSAWARAPEQCGNPIRRLGFPPGEARESTPVRWRAEGTSWGQGCAA